MISDKYFDKGYVSIVTGDTKVDSKWYPDLLQRNLGEWKKVVNQIATYMIAQETRYGFIITDAYLVVLRIRLVETGPGLGATRSLRNAREDNDIDVSMLSSGGESDYQDNNPLNVEYKDPEYALVPWENWGEGTLTVKLALWFLAMMAVRGPRDLDTNYPGINTWRSVGGGVYVHNTSGRETRDLPGGDVLDPPL